MKFFFYFYDRFRIWSRILSFLQGRNFDELWVCSNDYSMNRTCAFRFQSGKIKGVWNPIFKIIQYFLYIASSSKICSSLFFQAFSDQIWIKSFWIFMLVYLDKIFLRWSNIFHFLASFKKIRSWLFFRIFSDQIRIYSFRTIIVVCEFDHVQNFLDEIFLK